MPFNLPTTDLQPLLPGGWLAKEKPSEIQRGREFKQSIKLHLSCPHCGRQWTSMKGLALFKSGKSRTGLTHYLSCSIFLQECRKCHLYAQPFYYREEFSDTVQRVVLASLAPRSPAFPIRRKTGHPRSAHLPCEACKAGVPH